MTSPNIKEEEVPDYLGLISLLCQDAAQRFVLIDGRIFAHQEFNEANNAAHKHELRGKDVTELLRQHKHAPTSANISTLVQQITNTKSVTRMWDKSFPFRMFMPPA
jgi:hypothetical protein